MKKFFKILLISFLVSICTKQALSQCQLGEEDKGVYSQMQFSMQNHLYNDAKIRAKLLLTKYGDTCPQLYFDAGWLSFMTESWWDAVEFLKLSLWKLSYDRTKFEFAYSGVGIAYYELGSYSQSISYLDDAIRINGKADYYKYRGLSYYKLEDYNNAMLDFNTAKKYGSEFDEDESDIFWDAASKIKN